MEFPDEYREQSRTKNVVRFYTTHITSLLPQIEEAKDALDNIL